jgi:hypothetical protein
MAVEGDISTALRRAASNASVSSASPGDHAHGDIGEPAREAVS